MNYSEKSEYQGEQQYASMRNETMDLFVRPPHDLPKGATWVDWSRFELGVFYYMIPTSHTRDSAQQLALESYFYATKQGPIATTSIRPKQDEHEPGEANPLYWEVTVIPRKKSYLRHQLDLSTQWFELANAGANGLTVQEFKEVVAPTKTVQGKSKTSGYVWDNKQKRPVPKMDVASKASVKPFIPSSTSAKRTSIQ